MWGYKVGSPCFGIEINITGLGDVIPFPAAGRRALVPVWGVITSESDQQADDDLCGSTRQDHVHLLINMPPREFGISSGAVSGWED